MIIKCKMCGGDVEFNKGDTVGICLNCGTKQTLPRLDDDKKANLYDRANHFRRNNDYDKAMGIYEQILNEDNTDAEAYWSLVLCKYGIEYVEDPTTHKRVPTVNRTQFTSIYADDDYKSALKYADQYQRAIYEEEAKAIDEIQKGILDISSKEEPFDVFICYKETDANGRRTPDSVLANELYHLLTQEGFKVFFSRITLEDKLGEEYEPYIFAALNSAKVMVVIGTKPEYFNAPWVKNEWSRYLSLIKNGAKKVLIPAYRDMDPYDLPEEFSHLQAQDMSKLGFMQDLTRGIKKIVDVDKPKPVTKETTIINNTASNVNSLLDRMFIFIEDGDFENADIYCEKVLDIEPRNAKAYLGKLLIELEVNSKEDLANLKELFTSSNNYQRIMKYGDDTLKQELNSYLDSINTNRIDECYIKLLDCIDKCTNEESYRKVADAFNKIIDYKNSKELQQQCLDKAEEARKQAIYESASPHIQNNTIEDYESAIRILEPIKDFGDSNNQIAYCRNKIEELKAKAEADRIEAERKAEEERIAKLKKRKKTIAIGVPTILAIIAFVVVLITVIIPKQKYDKAMSMIENGDNNSAYVLLKKLSYKDSETKALELFEQHIFEKLKVAKVGDAVYFGSYEQDYNTSNSEEIIEWRVLAKEGNKILVISEQTLDCKQYNTSYEGVIWETCTLRKWLNDTFLNEAFSKYEQDKILNTNVTADKNPEYSTNPGSNTTDKVFLLSINEVNKYFSFNEDRKCVPTDYAFAQGAYTSDSYKKDNKATCWWWLRSPGYDQIFAAYVNFDGSVDYSGHSVINAYSGVRPALWINLES